MTCLNLGREVRGYGGPVRAEKTLNNKAEKSASINWPSDKELPMEYMRSTEENWMSEVRQM